MMKSLLFIIMWNDSISHNAAKGGEMPTIIKVCVNVLPDASDQCAAVAASSSLILINKMMKPFLGKTCGSRGGSRGVSWGGRSNPRLCSRSNVRRLLSGGQGCAKRIIKQLEGQ